jgi:hypothetical protein
MKGDTIYEVPVYVLFGSYIAACMAVFFWAIWPDWLQYWSKAKKKWINRAVG